MSYDDKLGKLKKLKKKTPGLKGMFFRLWFPEAVVRMFVSLHLARRAGDHPPASFVHLIVAPESSVTVKGSSQTPLYSIKSARTRVGSYTH